MARTALRGDDLTPDDACALRAGNGARAVGQAVDAVRAPVDRLRRCALLGAGSWWFSAAAAPPQSNDEWLGALRRGGIAVLMRHTQTTSGVGDPPGWTLDRCDSQRNLDAIGIDQARRIGRWFARHQLIPTSIRHSPWCRTRDTARLAFGHGEVWAALSNIFEDRSRADAQAAEVRRFVAALRLPELVVLISHGSLISHITGVGTAPGEAVLVGPARAPAAGASGAATLGIDVLGRLQVPA